jgi:hypothetical protein
MVADALVAAPPRLNGTVRRRLPVVSGAGIVWPRAATAAEVSSAAAQASPRARQAPTAFSLSCLNSFPIAPIRTQR